jgi:hypothetical protein
MNLNEISSELAKRVSKLRKLQQLQSTVKGLSSLHGDEVAKHSQDADMYLNKAKAAKAYANKPTKIRESYSAKTEKRIKDLERIVKEEIRLLRQEILEHDKNLNEKWSKKYKRSINCSHPKGFSQRAHCAGKKKHNESAVMEMICPDCGMCKTHSNLNEDKKRQMSRAAKGTMKYGKDGMKALAKAGKDGASEKKLDTIRDKYNQYDESAEQRQLEKSFDLIEQMVESLALEYNVDPEIIWEKFEKVSDRTLLKEAAAWQKKSGKNKNGGLNKKGVASYRREHPGSKLQTAVTTKPSKLKKGSKASKRRKSFCARMKGMKKKRTGAKTKRDPNSRINKSLRKWNC